MGGVLAKICWDENLIANIVKEALEIRGLKLPSEFMDIFKDELYQAWLRTRETLREESFAYVIELTLKKLGVKCNREDIDFAVKKLEDGIFCIVEEDAEDVLRELKSMGLKIGLISNAPGVFPINVIKRYGLDKYMDAMITSYQIGVVKPHPKIFKEMLKKLEVKPEEAIYVGDVADIDVRGAKRVGIKALLIRDGDPVMKKRGMDRIPEDAEPDYIIDELWDIVKIVKEINNR